MWILWNLTYSIIFFKSLNIFLLFIKDFLTFWTNFCRKKAKLKEKKTFNWMFNMIGMGLFQSCDLFANLSDVTVLCYVYMYLLYIWNFLNNFKDETFFLFFSVQRYILLCLLSSSPVYCQCLWIFISIERVSCLFVMWIHVSKLFLFIFKHANIQTWKKPFFFYSTILGMQIWRKKHVNYDKFEIATKQRKSNIFLLFDRCYMILPCYLHST